MAMQWRAIPFSFLLGSLMALAVGQIAIAQSSSLTPVYNHPLYDPVAKKYFVLVDARAPPGTPYPRNEGLNWELADLDARSREFKGVRGRLAVVDSAEVHAFLLENFHSEFESWIGLRYMCNSKKLQSADGKFLAPNSFQAWAAKWNQDIYSCKSATMGDPKREQYMPIAYQRPGVGPFQWIGKGWFKRYYSYFAEFPTGHP